MFPKYYVVATMIFASLVITSVLGIGANTVLAQETDTFGTIEIYPSAGREWFADWDDRSTVAISSGERDPGDAETLMTGDGTGTVMGDGRFKLEGNSPRVHVIDEDASRELNTNDAVNLWKNTEVTAYFYVEGQNQDNDEDTGIGIEVRLGDYVGDYLPDQCETNESEGDALGYSYNMFMRYDDARTAVQKEIKDHGMYTDSVGNINTFGSGDIPLNTWFGLKLVTVNYNDDENVKLEVWFDENADDNWEKLIEFNDNGDWTGTAQGVNADNCDERPDDMVITWGTPDVRIRADNADPVYLKDVSVREIEPLD